MRAIILAGGRGTRLKPYTTILPKPLIPIGDMPILEVVLRQLRSRGFTQITLAVGHLAELIQAYFGNGEKWDLQIDYSREHSPLGTMGPLKLIPELPDHFLVMNGDILTDLDFDDFYRAHCRNDSIFTVAAYHRGVNIDFGVLQTDTNGELVGFHEKPDYEFDVSMGVYTVSRRVLDHIPPGTPFGFDELMLRLIEKKEHPRVHHHTGYWLDIGREEDCVRAIQEFPELKAKLLP
jgi:NDP-sugar pyrophosphorylase family protein